MMLNDHKNIIDRYRLRIEKTNEQAHYFYHDYGFYSVDESSTMQAQIRRQAIYNIKMTENELDSFLSHLYRIDTMVKNYEDTFYDKQEQHERYIRRNNQAVQKAYDTYRMLLQLADQGKS